MRESKTIPNSQGTPASLLIILKCVLSDKQITYIEIDTGARSWELKGADATTNYRLSLGNLAPKPVWYELDIAMRFANTAEEAVQALERLGYPQKLTVSVLRVEPLAQRVILDFMPNRPSEAAPLPERMKISRKKKGESDGEVAAEQGP